MKGFLGYGKSNLSKNDKIIFRQVSQADYCAQSTSSFSVELVSSPLAFPSAIALFAYSFAFALSPNL
jgi:hypothetical protein